VLAECERLGAKRVVVSTNLRVRQDGIPYSGQPKASDPGVAVWFWLPKKGVGKYVSWSEKTHSEHVLACDRWNLVEHNLRAIGKHIDALRAQERWGVGSVAQAFAGYQALPSGMESGRPWWQVLGIMSNARTEEVQLAFKRLALLHHPDRGGDVAKFHELEQAREQALKEIG
jgi:hypothetical protein